MENINDRYSYNKRILELLTILVDKHPELRFCQLLWCMDIITRDKNTNKIIDNFYEESIDTFKKIKEDYKILAQEKALDLIFPDSIEPKDVYEKVLEVGLTEEVKIEEINND